MEDWFVKHKDIIEAVAALVAITLFFWGILKWGKSILQNIWHKLSRFRPHVPRETIRALPQLHGNWWHMGLAAGKPAMQVSGRWFTTNITGDPVLLLCARLSRPRKEGIVMVKHPDQDIFGRYPILPGATTEVSVDFWIQPPVCKEGQDFRTTLILIDQFGNEHKMKRIIFRAPSPKKLKEILKEIPITEESIHSILDPIAKEVAAVLRAEIYRYRDCGRSIGGLGSVQTLYKGNLMTGVGTEWREASPKNQAIITDAENACIKSDNATALLNLYNSFGKRKWAGERQAEVTRFVQALLKRLSKTREYAPVGYLILLVLFRIGRLKDALSVAKTDLQGDVGYGFSDFLRLLDGLLRFEHPSFSYELLDEVDNFLEGLEEDTFGIRERVGAIKAFRLGRLPGKE